MEQEVIAYRNGALWVENTPIPNIAQAVGTPVYIYASAVLTRRYQAFESAFKDAGLKALICFAVKANGNLSVLRTLARLGAGADVVSEGELRRALKAGVPAAQIVFSGVGKTAAEMAFALRAGILQFNVESAAELDLLARVAQEAGQAAPVALRVNPDVDAGTHDKITTGKKDNKFGVPIEQAPALYARMAASDWLQPVSVSVHIGSQLSDLTPFRLAFARVTELVRSLRTQGVALRRLDLGGGLGVQYAPDDPPPPPPAAYARMVHDAVGALDLPVVLEPGRALVAPAGVLVMRVLYEKQQGDKRFVIVDAAMNDFLRPALYDGRHPVLPVAAAGAGGPAEDASRADVAGPVCESADVLARDQLLPPLKEGDLLALTGAGAYGATMASTYNARLLIPEVLVKGDRFAVVRPRPDYEDVMAQEPLADWL